MNVRNKISICLLWLLISADTCKIDRYYEKECTIPEFLTGNKKLALNSNIDNIPVSDSLSRELFPSPFSWLPLERDTLYYLILYNKFKSIGMDCQIQASSDRKIRVISIVAGFHNLKSLKEADDLYQYFLKNISEYYSVQASSVVDTIISNPERPNYVDFIGKMYIPQSGYCQIHVSTTVEKSTYKLKSASLSIFFESSKRTLFFR